MRGLDGVLWSGGLGGLKRKTDDFIYCYNYSINYINTIEDHILHRIITTIASMLALYVDLHYS